MTADVQMSFLASFLVEWIHRHVACRLTRLQLKDDSVHPVNRAWLAVSWKQFFTSHSTCHDITNQWIALRKVSCEIHLFPLVSLLYSQSWESEVGSNRVGSYEVHLAVMRFDVDIVWVLFLTKLFHAEGVDIRV